MIGIYQDEFLKLIEDNLGPVVINQKNIICRCPWCEMDVDKSHYHFYILLDTPMYHCFSFCSKSGMVSNLIKRLNGDKRFEYFDRETIRVNNLNRISFKTNEHRKKDIVYPELNEELFPKKALYLRNRSKFQLDINRISGLVFDINEFLKLNNINFKNYKMKPFLQDNFIGFVTENNSFMVLRNIDRTSEFRYFKIKISETNFLDYYRLNGNSPDSNKVILGEGLFDVLLEHTFDSLNLKNEVALYASCQSMNYGSLIKSLTFYENIFRLDVYILSDQGVNLNFYKKLKRNNSHIINTLKVYYNRDGKDFAEVPVESEKFVM